MLYLEKSLLKELTLLTKPGFWVGWWVNFAVFFTKFKKRMIVSSQWPVGALVFELAAPPPGTNLNGVHAFQFDVRKPILKFSNSIPCPCIVFLKIGRGLYNLYKMLYKIP